MSDPFFSQIDEARVVKAIHDAEGRSRGEIRVHITEGEATDVMLAAKEAFEKLGMTATAERNGVLIFIAPRSHQFAVLGDVGLTTKAGTDPLDAAAAQLSGDFRERRFTEGLVGAIERLGSVLSAHFPPSERNKDADELSNEISRG